jgi:hypothetical protein
LFDEELLLDGYIVCGFFVNFVLERKKKYGTFFFNIKIWKFSVKKKNLEILRLKDEDDGGEMRSMMMER